MTAPDPSRALRVLALTAAVVVACEHPGVPHPLAAAEPDHDTGLFPAVVSDAGAAVAGVGAGSATGGAAAGAAEPKATVRFKDFQLDPEDVTVAAGLVRFTLVNQGRYTHDFRIEGNGIDDRSPRIGAGRTITWEITLQPGEYRISCPVSNHAARGMRGTLTAVER